MQVNPFTERERPASAALCATAVALLLILGGCGGDDNGDSAGGTATPGAGAATTSSPKCGLGNGEKASGTPIKIGAIVTKQPGTDFTDITNTAKAYFDCVNDNGGINGKPIEYLPQPEQTDPGADRLAGQEARRERAGRRDRRQHLADRVRGQPQVLGVQGLQRDRRRHRPRVLLDAERGRRQHGPALQLRRCRAVPDPQGRQEDRVRAVQRAGHGLHRGRPEARRRGREHPDRVAEGERADPGRELGRAQGRAGGRRGRRRRAQLHAARGAEDPPGRAAPRPAGPRRSGAARRRATPTSWPTRWGRRGTTSCSSTRS